MYMLDGSPDSTSSHLQVKWTVSPEGLELTNHRHWGKGEVKKNESVSYLGQCDDSAMPLEGSVGDVTRCGWQHREFMSWWISG